LGLLQLFDVEVGDADPAHLALALQLCQRGPALVGFLSAACGPVDLVQVDDLHA
jgi:hypothetical protein